MGKPSPLQLSSMPSHPSLARRAPRSSPSGARYPARTTLDPAELRVTYAVTMKTTTRYRLTACGVPVNDRLRTPLASGRAHSKPTSVGWSRHQSGHRSRADSVVCALGLDGVAEGDRAGCMRDEPGAEPRLAVPAPVARQSPDQLLAVDDDVGSEPHNVQSLAGSGAGQAPRCSLWPHLARWAF